MDYVGSESSSVVFNEDVLNKILAQLEFYFGDANLKRDRYLRQMIEGTATGFVPISELITFSRVKALTNQPSIVAQAAKLSNNLQVSEDNLGIARKAPLPKNEQPVEACIWIKGLPFNATLEEISQAVKSVDNVETYSIFLRKDNQQLFDGEAFVELGNAEEVSLVVERGAKSLLFRNHPQETLELLPLAEWMSKFKKTTKLPKPTNSEATAEKPSIQKKDANIDRDKPTEIEVGGLLVLEGLPSDCSREAIKAAINARITFIDYERGNEKAIIRFPSAEDCKQGIASLEKEKEKNTFKLNSYRVMDATETSEYANLVDERRKQRISGQKSGAGGSNSRDRKNRFQNKVGNVANQPKPKRSRDDPQKA